MAPLGYTARRRFKWSASDVYTTEHAFQRVARKKQRRRKREKKRTRVGRDPYPPGRTKASGSHLREREELGEEGDSQCRETSVVLWLT